MARISILIPTYAYAPLELVGELAGMCKSSPLCEAYEICVIDDGSGNDATIRAAEAINRMPCCRFTALPNHAGKSALLNKAAAMAKYPLLLLIDSDARMHSAGFITDYLKASEMHPESVICGGVYTSPESATRSNQLRYRYERAATKYNMASVRQLHPYSRFTTFNVLLPKKVIREVPFDESLSRYGYEDTLFGLQLEQHGIPVVHIDNPLTHTGIDDNAAFLSKTETALCNLSMLGSVYQQSVTLSATAMRFRQYGLAPLVRLFHSMFGNYERRNLLGNRPSLFLFKLYKLGYFLSLPKARKA